MSYDNQGYSSNNPGASDNQGASDTSQAGDPQHDSAQQPYAEHADTGFETTTHRTSMFGNAQQGYSGQDGTHLSGPAGAYPSSHSSASNPASHSSANYAGQGSTAYPTSYGSGAAGYEQAGWGAQQQAPDQAWGTQHPPDQGWGAHPQAHDQAWGTQQQHAPQQAWNAPQQQRPTDDNVVSALTDFSFTKMATPGLVKILYIAATVLGILQVLGFTFSAFTLGNQIGTAGIVLGILGLIGGLVGLLVFVLAVRIYLELALSVVRTSQDVRHIRSKFDDAD